MVKLNLLNKTFEVIFLNVHSIRWQLIVNSIVQDDSRIKSNHQIL